MLNNKIKPNLIAAVHVVSESEIVKVYPFYDSSIEQDNHDSFLNILHNFGMDVERSYVRQDGLQHKNRFGDTVICSRFVGSERLDKEWLTSGLASQEAKDKASGSRMVEDAYRMRGLTEDVQAAMEARDTAELARQSKTE